jgi:hypothetical protein
VATMRKRRNRRQVEIRPVGHRPFSKSFLAKKDAAGWARQAEAAADRSGLLSAGFGRYLASVAMINIRGLDEVLEKHGPSLLH